MPRATLGPMVDRALAHPVEFPEDHPRPRHLLDAPQLAIAPVPSQSSTLLARDTAASNGHIDTSRPRPVILVTDVKVSQIARELVQMAMTPEEVVTAHPHQTLADVHVAISAARSNRIARAIPWRELREATGIAPVGGGNAVEDCDALYDDA